jgi:phosphoglycerate dehydrogenase-like enzyme
LDELQCETLTSIVVAFPPREGQREVFLNVLGKVARVVFLSDLPEANRAEELADADVLISWSLKRELANLGYETLSRARMVQLLSAGADHVPFNQLPSSLTIASNAGAYAEPMAEHIIAMILAITKSLIDRHDKLKKGVFEQSTPNRMLRGSNCAILGFGGIGRATARLMRCFGVRIHAINTTGKTDEPVDFIGTLNDLEPVLHNAHIVVICLPLTKATRGLIGTRELGWISDSAILVNVARGQIVDEAALYEKLKNQPNFFAAIDAWWIEPLTHGEFRTDHPFLELPNVLGSPHNSGIARGSFLEATLHAAENVKRFLNHEPIRGIVRPSDYE